MQNILISFAFQTSLLKVEKQTLRLIDPVLELLDERSTKIAVLDWLPELESLPAHKKRKNNSLPNIGCALSVESE